MAPEKERSSMIIAVITLLALTTYQLIQASEPSIFTFNEEDFDEEPFEIISFTNNSDDFKTDDFIKIISTKLNIAKEDNDYAEYIEAFFIGVDLENETNQDPQDQEDPKDNQDLQNPEDNKDLESIQSEPIVTEHSSNHERVSLIFKVEEMARILNCDPSKLSQLDPDKLEKLEQLSYLTYSEMIQILAEIKDLDLFDSYFIPNFDLITRISSKLNEIILNCIKTDSVSSFEHYSSSSLILNIYLALVYSAKYGSIKIIEFILKNKTQILPILNGHEYLNLDLTLQNSMRNIYEEDFGMNEELYNFYYYEYLDDHFSGSCFLGALQSIRHNNLECLKLFVNNHNRMIHKDYLLLKESTKCPNLILFKFIYESIEEEIPESTMKDLFAEAVQNNNEALVHYLLTLKYNYKINTSSHLIPAIQNKNSNLVRNFLEIIPSDRINSHILNLAKMSSNDEIYFEVLAKNKLNRRR